LVPAAQNTPLAFVYIARSTTIWAGVVLKLCTIAPKRRFAARLKELPATVVRLFAGSAILDWYSRAGH